MYLKRALLTSYGFTLVELLVVVAIISLLVAIAIPQLRNFTQKAKRAEAVTLLTAFHKSQLSHFSVYEQFYPKNAFVCGANSVFAQSALPEINLPTGVTRLGWSHENFYAYGASGPPCAGPPKSVAYKIDFINEFDNDGAGPDRLRIHMNAPFMATATNGQVIQCYDDITNRSISPCP